MVWPKGEEKIEGPIVPGVHEAPLKLPKADRALIAINKVVGHLLSPLHPTGSAKARFFLGLGFTPARSLILVRALRRIAEEGEVMETVGTHYGTKVCCDRDLADPLRAKGTPDNGVDRP